MFTDFFLTKLIDILKELDAFNKFQAFNFQWELNLEKLLSEFLGNALLLLK